MRETGARRTPVLNRREQCAEIEAEPVRILVVRPAGLADKIKRVSADLRHRTLAKKRESILARHLKLEFRMPDILDPVTAVKEPDERADGG